MNELCVLLVQATTLFVLHLRKLPSNPRCFSLSREFIVEFTLVQPSVSQVSGKQLGGTLWLLGLGKAVQASTCLLSSQARQEKGLSGCQWVISHLNLCCLNGLGWFVFFVGVFCDSVFF